MSRELTPFELALIKKLLDVPFKGKEELRAQLSGIKADDLDDNDNYGSIKLIVRTQDIAEVEARVPVEGIALDNDGVQVSVLLHVVNGRLDELEIFKADGLQLISPLDPRAIEVTVNIV